MEKNKTKVKLRELEATLEPEDKVMFSTVTAWGTGGHIAASKGDVGKNAFVVISENPIPENIIKETEQELKIEEDKKKS